MCHLKKCYKTLMLCEMKIFCGSVLRLNWSLLLLKICLQTNLRKHLFLSAFSLFSFFIHCGQRTVNIWLNIFVCSNLNELFKSKHFVNTFIVSKKKVNLKSEWNKGKTILLSWTIDSLILISFELRKFSDAGINVAVNEGRIVSSC